MAKRISISELKEGILSGNIMHLSRAITLVESTVAKHKQMAAELMDSILPYIGKSIRVGITGVPGVGKSTFIEAFGVHILNQGHRLAVLAIDPSSNISKGSILGDKTRMEQLSVHPNAYIRPSASAGSLGGLTYKTREAMLLCEAAGYDVVIVETVGVGQSETAVSQITDFFLLLMLAGAGDELQGIKRGIMEMADGMVITKADGDNVTKAKNARSEYARALHFFPPHPSGWIPQVKTASSYNNEGMEALWQMRLQYQAHTLSQGYWIEKRNQQNLFAFDKLLNDELLLLIKERLNDVTLENLKKAILNSELSPYSGVKQLLDSLFSTS